MIALFLVAAALLVALGGLLAAADAAIGTLSRSDLLEVASSARAKRSIEAVAADPGPHANAVNFLRIVAETTAAVLVAIALLDAFDDLWLALLVSALVMTGASFVLVGSSPRSVGRQHARAVVRLTAPLVRGIRVLLGPIAAALVALGDRVTPGRTGGASGVSSEEHLLSMVDEAAENDVLEEDDRELIHSIFEFGETYVREVMVPRTDMVTLEGDAGLDAGYATFFERGVSRIPVIGDDVDDVLGVLYLRDLAKLLRGGEPLAVAGLAELVRPAVFVPESMRADALLRRMQVERNHLAMVVDEYGGIAGLVTMEDLIEELVGEISDEYDRAVSESERLGDGRWRVPARLPVDELGELFDLELEDDDVDSVGGLLGKALGKVPAVGDTVVVSGIVLTAERTGRRRRLETVVAEADQSLIDVRAAFGRSRDGGENA